MNVALTTSLRVPAARVRDAILLVSLGAGLTGDRVEAQAIRIVDATVVDVASGRLQPNTTIVVQGNRIASVSGSSGPVARGDRVVDAKGLYVIPGLWDMHAHVVFEGDTAVANQLTLPLFIANGVTGVRDMGSALDGVLSARAAIAAHRLLGPRLIVSGPMLDGPDVVYKSSIAIKTPSDGKHAVDSLKRRGVDFIKVQSGVPRDAYFAIADEARRLGISLEGHVPDAIRASEAIAAHQRTFEHLIGIFEASSPDEDRYIRDKYIGGTKRPSAFLATYDPKREAQIIRQIAAAKVWQCPTLFWERGQWLVDTVDYRKDPDLAYAAHTDVAHWPASAKDIVKSLSSDSLSVRVRFVAHELELVRRLHAANVPFLAGTDTPAGVDVIPGISLHRELERFVAAGFTPLEALQTATLNPALFYGKTADFGSIQPGRIADIVLLRANPLTDIRNTRSVVGVVADGRYLSRSQLDELRAKLRKTAAAK